MAGRYVREIEIKAKTDQAEKDIQFIQELVDELKKHEYKVSIGVDSQKLEKVIGNLEKMLDSLGKGTGDFKQFENLSKELSDVISEVQSLSKAFGKVDDSGTKTLLSSIQSIDKSLSDLSQHILNVNKDFGSVGKNATDNVGQINEAKKATEGLTDATEHLAKAQQNLNENKSNISSGNINNTNIGNQKQEVESVVNLVDNYGRELDEVNSKLLEGTALLDKQGKLIRLYHGSDVEFDKFDLSKSTNSSNQIYGKGAYLIENEKGAQGYGNVVTQWYANVRAVLNEEQQLTLEEAKKLYSEFGNQFMSIFTGKPMDFNEFFDNYLDFNPDETTIVEKMKSLSGFLGKDIGEVLSTIGYDAIKMDRANGTFYTIFDPDRIIRFKDETQKAVSVVNELNQAQTKSTIEDVFQNDSDSSSTAIANEQVSAMEKVENATEQAAQAKQDFVAANENVQNSVADSKSPLQLEAELMQQIAKDAHDAADAKKEFVEANKQVKDSADDSNGSVKRGHSENAEPSGTKKYKKRGYKAHDTGNHDNEVTVSKKSELGKVLKDLQTEIIASLDETTSFIKEVTDFYDSADNLVKTQMKVVDKDGSQRTYTTSYSTDKDGNATAWTSHIDTSNYEKQAKAAEQEAKSVEKVNRAYEQQIEKAKKLSEVNKKRQEKEQQSSVNSALKQQESAWKNIQSIREKIAKANPEDEDYISLLKETKIEYQKQYIEAGKVLKANQDIYDSEKQVNKLKQIQLEADAKISKYKASQKTSAVSSFQSSIDSYQSKLTKYSNRPTEKQSVEYQSLLKDYQSQLAQLKNRFDELSEEEIISKDQINSFNKLKKQLDTTDLKFQNVFKGDDLISVKKEIDTITQYMSKNTRISSEAKDKLRGYIEELKTKGADANVKAIHAAFLDVCDGERKAKREGQSFLDVLRDKVWYQWAAQIGSYFSFNDIIDYAKEGIQTVRELDTALVEMRKVSDESVQSLKNYQASTFDVADAVGTTAVQIQNSTADWMRLGYSIDEAAELAKNSNIYKNVGDMEIEEATEHMISSVQAWKSEFNDNVIDTSQAIIDRYNKIGNEFAISSADIGEAMETSAAALKAGGNSLNESLGILTAANIIQQDASTTSSALKILSLRIRGKIMPPYKAIYMHYALA